MRRRTLIAAALAIALLAAAAGLYISGTVHPTVTTSGNLSEIEVPDGFSIEVFADGLGAPRLVYAHAGALYVSVPSRGEVVAFPDPAESDRRVTVASGLNRPHGLAFHDGQVYVAETDAVARYDLDGLRAVEDSREVLVDGIPTGGHWTRTIRIVNRSLFIAAGSSCNVCEESSPWRAAVTRCGLDGSDCSAYATGLRNTVGFVEHRGRLVGTDNGRDHLGDNRPVDEINVIHEDGFYGWPYCYGQNEVDPAFGDASRCADAVPPAVGLQAHSAPLGLAFAPSAWPGRYADDLYVAYHGSWNRNPPTGYKVVRIPHDGSGFGEPQDFAEGWLRSDGTNSGRPVDVAFLDGAMYVTDDATGRIYRISP